MTVPPPPTGGFPVAFYDTECYPNYWLLKFRPKGQPAYSFRLRSGESFSSYTLDSIRRLFSLLTTVSFNGNYYDVPMITAALAGYTCEQLKWLNDQIIVEKRKPWELGLPEWKPADHIDVMEVAPGAGSQKVYAGRIHCKTMRDLPYNPSVALTEPQIEEVDSYCENDLDVLESLFDALAPQLHQREKLGKRYGLDLRSKSDAQLAEAVLKRQCELATGRRIFKPDIDWNLKFQYETPTFIAFQSEQLQRALGLVQSATFYLGASGSVTMPPQLEGLIISIGASTYKIGIGGIHSQEKCVAHFTDSACVLRDLDVASYYPSLILNSGRWPLALGKAFLQEYEAIKNDRLAAKALQKKLPENSPEWIDAMTDNEGGKIMINGTFGKTGSPYSVLFAPQMLIQTTLTGQLSLLMLIEAHELAGIPVVSANTDGIVTKCPREKVVISEALVCEWEKRTGLEMELNTYRATYSRDVNNYFAIKENGDVKRKGEYAKSGLVAKKNPDVEICSDAVAAFLSNGTPIWQTIRNCRDIRKFVTVRTVNGGGVKMWGVGPVKGAKVSDMVATLEKHGWRKSGRKWARDGLECSAGDAYNACFAPAQPEHLGKVVRWYYGTLSPGPIVYATNGNTVSLSYGAAPCMTLPDDFPPDVDCGWYIANCESILRDIGYYVIQ